VKTSTAKTKSIDICGKNIQTATIVIADTIIAKATHFVYLGNMICEFKTDIAKQNTSI
jgi:hypothetical protein